MSVMRSGVASCRQSSKAGPPGGSGHSHYDSGAECWVESGEWMIGWSRRHAGYGGIESIIR